MFLFVECQKPTIIDSSGSSDRSEEADGENDSSDSESTSSEKAETSTTGQPRPRAESPNSRKVASRKNCLQTDDKPTIRTLCPN